MVPKRAEAQTFCLLCVAPRAPSASRETEWSGRFKGVEIVEVCWFVNFKEKFGKLRVGGTDATGEIDFGYGKIVGARTGTLTGVEAARKLLMQPEGTFEF